MPIATATAYTRELTAARAIETKAANELRRALKHVEPISAELHELFLTRPADYAVALHRIADIVASLPALREAARVALDKVAELEKQMCTVCSGTGEYHAPTRALARGRAYCFTCGGDGRSKAFRG